MSEPVWSCVVCSPDVPAFTVPLTTEGMGHMVGHMQAEHEGQWENLPEDQLVHVHLAGSIERGSYQWSPTPKDPA